MRIRVPEQWRGDYLAMVGSARIGEREILSMAEEFGWETLHALTREWFDYSEKIMIAAIKKMPSGHATARSIHDPLPGTPPEGIRIKVAVEVDTENAVIEVDLRDNPDVMPCGLNLSESCARTAAMIGIFNSIEDPVPTNAGSFRRIRVKIRQGCIAGGGKHPTSMSAATNLLADRVTSPVQRAFSKIKDGLGLAECGPIIPASLGVISGIDPRSGNAPFINQLFLLTTGGAAGAIDSVELDELHFPILVHTRALLPDTEGAGRTIGAPSGVCEYGPLGGGTLEVAFVQDGVINNAKGTRKGHDGAVSRNYKKDMNGELMELPAVTDLILQPNETIITYTSGGGGYGPPYQRPLEKIKKDVEEGWITEKRAHEVYGVVLDKEGEVDVAATSKMRKRLKKRASVA
jgi:N-methylhydantoinase B